MKTIKRRILWMGACLLLLQGCYIFEQAGGQMDLRFNQLSLEKAIEIEKNPEHVKLLKRVPEIKNYAESVLHLKPTENYTGYYKTKNDGITYVVTASSKTELKAKTWWFPIFGELPYKGYFDRKDAEEVEEALKAEGYINFL